MRRYWQRRRGKDSEQSSSTQSVFATPKVIPKKILAIAFGEMCDIWENRRGVKIGTTTRILIMGNYVCWEPPVAIPNLNRRGAFDGWDRRFHYSQRYRVGEKGRKAPKRGESETSETTLRDNDSPPHRSMGGIEERSKLKEDPQGPIFESREWTRGG